MAENKTLEELIKAAILKYNGDDCQDLGTCHIRVYGRGGHNCPHDCIAEAAAQAIHDAGFVQLDADQTLPPIAANALESYSRDEVDGKCVLTQRKMLEAGFKKVKLC